MCPTGMLKFPNRMLTWPNRMLMRFIGMLMCRKRMLMWPNGMLMCPKRMLMWPNATEGYYTPFNISPPGRPSDEVRTTSKVNMPPPWVRDPSIDQQL